MSPRARVSPSTQFHTSGATVTLKCHVDGVPEPDVLWEMNEVPLPTADVEDRDHYALLREYISFNLHLLLCD